MVFRRGESSYAIEPYDVKLWVLLSLLAVGFPLLLQAGYIVKITMLMFTALVLSIPLLVFIAHVWNILATTESTLIDGQKGRSFTRNIQLRKRSTICILR